MKLKSIRSLGIMLDCSRDAVYSVETLKRYFGLLKKMGYTYVQLYTEDVYEVEGEPYFGYLRGRYTKRELKELDAAARENGLELVPCIQTLAHLGGIARWNEYSKTCIDFGDILLAGEERTYELIEKMFQTCAECFMSRRINIGMDEAHMVGLGKYLDRHGYENRFDILLNHLTRVAKIAEQYGFSPMMWSDMFFRLANKGQYYCTGGIPEAIRALVPKNVTLVYWDYYSTDRAHYDGMLRAHQEFENPVVFAGGDSGWYGFAPHNRYAVRTWRAAMEACRESGVEDAFVTCWKDDGAECSPFATLPALFSAAEYARGNFDEEAIAEKFRRFTGICMEDFLALDEVNLNADSPVNPCKYMLYSDPFLGIFDRTVKGDGSQFSAVREGLRAGAKSVRYGYLFKTLMALCDVLEIKYDLGVRTRKAYRADDRGALAALVADYGELEKRLKAFYRLFLAQRERECKPQGVEKQDIRLGGLMQRVAHCRRILSEYLACRRDRIEELEEHILPFAGGQDGAPVCFNDWLHTAQIKPLM